MDIIVSHVYSKANKGDAALLSVLLDDIHRTFSGAQITILTLDKTQKNETFEGVPVENGFMYYARERYQNPFLRLIYGIFLVVGTMLWAILYRITQKNFPLPKYLRQITTLYEKADLIIPVGGGYIRSKAGFMPTVTLLFILHPFFFTYILGKPTVNYAQSIGPFGNKFQEFMAKAAVKRLTGIIVRDSISFKLIKQWGVSRNVLLSIDSGFSFVGDETKDLRKELNISKRHVLVGITVRNWLRAKEQTRYERTMAILCDHIIEKYNAAILFIPQVTVEHHGDDDRESGQRIYTFMKHQKSAYVMTNHQDHGTIKAIYANLDYLVGTRFHSVIFALTSYVPAIAIGYEHKTLGIMTDLGLEGWVIDMQKIQSDQLIGLFDRLVISRSIYIEHLKKILPKYIEQANKSISFVKATYDKYL